MKFCMVTTFFPPYHMGGDAVMVARLGEALARRGHQVDVVHDVDAFYASGGRQPAGEYRAPAGVRVHPLRSPFRRLSPLLTHQTGRSFLKGPLRARLSSGSYDVVHFHNISLVGLEALGWARGAVRLLTLHEHWLVCPLSVLWRYDREVCDHRECVRCTVHAGRPPQLWRSSGYLRSRLAELDAIIAPSQFVGRSHRERGLDLETTLLPHFVPGRPASATDHSAPPHDRPFYLCVGRLVREKGVHTLFDAFTGTAGPDLVVVGDGEFEHELRARAAGFPRVRFAGRQSPEVLDVFYRHARAVLVPSLCLEVFGLVVLEAFAAGTPVIARNQGALAEIVNQSDGGLLFSDPAELRAAIERMEHEPSLRERLAANGGAALAAHWTEARHLDDYLSLVGRLTAARQATAGGPP